MDREEALKPLLTKEFLDTLAEAAKVSGWTFDYSEIHSFVDWCYYLVNVPPPNLEPYPVEECEDGCHKF